MVEGTFEFLKSRLTFEEKLYIQLHVSHVTQSQIMEYPSERKFTKIMNKVCSN